MEHNMHVNAPLHWGYSAAPLPSTPQSHWVPPPQTHIHLKRALSESDCDELYSEESSKEQISPSETGSCQLMSRKKRRGVIEKKRRDRINSSLSELKRLVPSAYEKQGSAKLEKAEILQLTVEHLKTMQTKGLDSLSYDPQRFAMDYHIIGFRECAAEVARYLVTIEGMDIQDPLRLRLMSHLQYFAQQRELSAKSCVSPGGWSATAAASAYQPNCAATPYQTAYTGSASSSAYMPNLPAPIHPYPTLSASPNALSMQQHTQHPLPTVHHVTRSSTSRASVTAAASDTMPTVMSHATAQQQQQQHDVQAQATHAQQATAQHETTQHQQQQTSTAPQAQVQPATQQQQQQQQQQHYTQEHTHGGEHQVPTYIELTNSQSHAAQHTHAHAHAHVHARNEAAATITAESLSYSGATGHYPVVDGQDYANPNVGIQYATPNGSKPYRPWGAEMAY